jgi:hypothetical protein
VLSSNLGESFPSTFEIWPFVIGTCGLSLAFRLFTFSEQLRVNLVCQSTLELHKFHKSHEPTTEKLHYLPFGEGKMSATITLPCPTESKKNDVPVKCLLWRICPIVTVKDKECVHKGDSSCKEFLRLLNNAGQFMAR